MCQLKERKKNKIMPDGIFDKLRNIASGAVKSGFKFAKSNLPTIAATALFGPVGVRLQELSLALNVKLKTTQVN